MQLMQRVVFAHKLFKINLFTTKELVSVRLHLHLIPHMSNSWKAFEHAL